MKKLVYLVLLVLLCGMLSGCGGEDLLAEAPNPIATIHLTNGKSMRFELFLQDAPNTVANFVELARDGFYDGLSFFRVVPGALVQAGSPNNSLIGGAGHTIQGEFSENGIANSIAHTRGTISMSRQSGFDTASSQFFIMQGSYPEYNGHYAAFGRAVDAGSLAVLDEIASVAVDGRHSPVGTLYRIRTIEVETGGYEYESAKIFPDEEEKKD